MHNLIYPDHFVLPSGLAYLDSDAEGIPPLAVQAALAAYLRAKYMGTTGRTLLYQEQELLESSIASLLGTQAEHIVTLANSSVALNLLAQSIDWLPGDEVLICDLEFPSNVLPWLQLKSRGVRLVVVPSCRTPRLDRLSVSANKNSFCKSGQLQVRHTVSLSGTTLCPCPCRWGHLLCGCDTSPWSRACVRSRCGSPGRQQLQMDARDSRSRHRLSCSQLARSAQFRNGRLVFSFRSVPPGSLRIFHFQVLCGAASSGHAELHCNLRASCQHRLFAIHRDRANRSNCSSLGGQT